MTDSAPRPVLVLMQSRTGSSMVAGIFAAHGLYTGPRYVTGSGYGEDYASYEIPEIKAWLRMRYPLQGAELVDDCHAAEFAGFLRNLIPPGRRWLAKVGVMFWPLFRQFRPHLVLIKRDFEASVEAIMKRPNPAPEPVVRDLIARRYALMDGIQADYGGTLVHTDRIIEGDYAELEAAFTAAGLDFDPQTAKTVIQPDRWHFKRDRLA